jgi:hypothetical protein
MQASGKPKVGDVSCKMVIMDPAAVAPPIVGQTVVQVVPILAFWIFQQSLDLVQWLRRGMEPKKSSRRRLAEAYGASIAQEFGAKTVRALCGRRVCSVRETDTVGERRRGRYSGAQLPRSAVAATAATAAEPWGSNKRSVRL